MLLLHGTKLTRCDGTMSLHNLAIYITRIYKYLQGSPSRHGHLHNAPSPCSVWQNLCMRQLKHLAVAVHCCACSDAVCAGGVQSCSSITVPPWLALPFPWLPFKRAKKMMAAIMTLAMSWMLVRPKEKLADQVSEPALHGHLSLSLDGTCRAFEAQRLGCMLATQVRAWASWMPVKTRPKALSLKE